MSDQSDLFPASPARRNDAQPSLARWNDALVYGDLAAPAARSVLSQTIVTASSMGEFDDPWRRRESTVEDLIESILSRHPSRTYVSEPSIRFVDAPPEGSLDARRCRPSRAKIAATTAVGFSLKCGSFARIIERCAELGYFAIAYTTCMNQAAVTDLQWPWLGRPVQSCGVERLAVMAGLPNVLEFRSYEDEWFGMMVSIRHDPLPNFHVIFPLSTPFELEPAGGPDRIARCLEWGDRLHGFADQALEFDVHPTDYDVKRTFYTPGHRPNDMGWRLGIIGGRALRVEEMPLGQCRRYRHRRSVAATAEIPNHESSRPVLSDGFDLLRWYGDYGHRFQISNLLSDLGWKDVATPDGNGAEEDQPYKADWPHVKLEFPRSSAGNPQDREVYTCSTRDGDGVTPFSLNCDHPRYRDITTLGFLASLERAIILPDGYLFLSQMLCDPTFTCS